MSENRVGIFKLNRNLVMIGSFGRSSSTKILWMLGLSATMTF